MDVGMCVQVAHCHDRLLNGVSTLVTEETNRFTVSHDKSPLIFNFWIQLPGRC